MGAAWPVARERGIFKTTFPIPFPIFPPVPNNTVVKRNKVKIRPEIWQNETKGAKQDPKSQHHKEFPDLAYNH